MKFLSILFVAVFLTLQAQAQSQSYFALRYVVEVKISAELLQDEMVQNLLIKPSASTRTSSLTNEVIIKLIDPTQETTDYINALEAANLLTKISESMDIVDSKKKSKVVIPGGAGGGPKIGPIDEGGGGGLDIHPNTCKKYDLDCTPPKEDKDKPPGKFPKCFKTSHGVICF